MAKASTMSTKPDLLTPDGLLKIISKSELATAVYETNDIIIRFANEAMLSFWGKDESIIGLPLEEGVPELKGQPFKEMLVNVLESGIEDIGIIPATTSVNGELTTAYYDYKYIPLKDKDGVSYGILHTAKDVTELQLIERENQRISDHLSAVNEELAASNEELRLSNLELQYAQKELNSAFSNLEDSETALRLAIEAANFGTWHIHSVTRAFITSARLKELFGYQLSDQITIEDALSCITDEYRDYVSAALENAIYKGGKYDVTYPVIGFYNKKLRWLRAIGNLKTYPEGGFSAFTGVVMDVTETKLTEQRKDDFIGMVSHELKTPLTSLKGYLQLIKLKAQNKDVFTTNAVEKTLKQVKKMTTMINGFLNISRLESGKIHVNKESFDIAHLLGDIREETSDLYPTHNLQFHPADSVILKADHDKLGQVILNFISNAVKYSPANSTIIINCYSDEDTLEIKVSDQGKGIPKADLSKVFERYYRVEENNGIAGFGIGLYLCSEIIERHGGKIWAESILGSGSVFSFSIPLK